MDKIKEILIGTNNQGKYREIYDLLPKDIKKYSPRELNIKSPEETGKSFKSNSFIKASFFSKKTNLICLADDSGLEVKLLKGAPGIYSSRWAGKKNNFNSGIKRIYKKMRDAKVDWYNYNLAKFVCCMTLFWPNGKKYSSTGIINGAISLKKEGKNGFGYDPIFIPNGYKLTFAQMKPKFKMSIDHRSKAFKKLKLFFI
jgi:XTP/dITP diphosphohydrolase